MEEYSDQSDDDGWEDINEEGDSLSDYSQCLCLFCPEMSNSAQATLKHMVSFHSFDLLGKVGHLNLDFYLYVKFVNYIRKCKPSPQDLASVVIDTFKSDEYLIPVLEDDLMLQLDIEEEIKEEATSKTSMQYKSGNLVALEERARTAEDFLERAVSDLNACRSQLQSALMEKSILPSDKLPSCQTSHERRERTDSEGEAYFGSYAHFGIHEEMLKDTVRTESYRDFMSNNSHIFKDKVVLDVGCGSGILSMFAAKAGARRVIAVDHSEVAYQAMDIVKENNLDKVVTVIKARAEDLILPDKIDKVDIIISEWMGYFLLFESMLDTVLLCRDLFLQEGGCVYPDKCSIELAALCDEQLYADKVSYWQDVYGFKMSAMKSSVIEEPLIKVVAKDNLISKPCSVKSIDLMRSSVCDLDFDSHFSLDILADGTIHAIVGYFDIDFDQGLSSPVSFSTGPMAEATHWKQTVFFLKEPIAVHIGQAVRGRIFCKKNKSDHRALDIALFIFKDNDDILLRQHYVIS